MFSVSNRLGRGSAGIQTQRGVGHVAIVLLVGMAASSWILSQSVSSAASSVGVGITAWLVYLAAAALGVALGFLLGLPRARLTDELASRALEDDVSETAGKSNGMAVRTSTAMDAKASATHFLANTNFIKVSDWLTTILVGLGLANLGSLFPAIRSLGEGLQHPLGDAPHSGVAGVAIAIFGVISGLLLGYLWTSIRVRELFEEAENGYLAVPNFEGMTLEMAKKSGKLLGIQVISPTGAQDSSVIARQSIAPGAVVEVGKPVDVTPR